MEGIYSIERTLKDHDCWRVSRKTDSHYPLYKMLYNVLNFYYNLDIFRSSFPFPFFCLQEALCYWQNTSAFMM